MTRRGRIPGMAGRRSFAIPLCSVHKTPGVQAPGGWVCPTCVDEHIDRMDAKYQGKAEKPTFQELLPNRRARRAVMHS